MGPGLPDEPSRREQEDAKQPVQKDAAVPRVSHPITSGDNPLNTSSSPSRSRMSNVGVSGHKENETVRESLENLNPAGPIDETSLRLESAYRKIASEAKGHLEDVKDQLGPNEYVQLAVLEPPLCERRFPPAKPGFIGKLKALYARLSSHPSTTLKDVKSPALRELAEYVEQSGLKLVFGHDARGNNSPLYFMGAVIGNPSSTEDLRNSEHSNFVDGQEAALREAIRG